jgi:hypothetical protein
MPHNGQKKKRGPRPKEIDGDEVRQMSMIGSSIATIAEHFHCSRDTIERRFRYEIDQGKSNGQIRVRGKLFQAAMNGSQRALEVCAVNLCGMSLNKPETVVNVVQNAVGPMDPRDPKKLRRVFWRRIGTSWQRPGARNRLKERNRQGCHRHHPEIDAAFSTPRRLKNKSAPSNAAFWVAHHRRSRDGFA